LCNEHGLPLRWEVIQGLQADAVALGRMCSSIAGVSWASEAPLVCDRAMGKTAQIREMLATKLRFVTALTVTEFDAYAPTLPHAQLAELAVLPDDHDRRSLEEHVAAAARAAEAAGMKRVEDDLWVLDLGIVERPEANEARARQKTAHRDESTTAHAMRLSREIEDAVEQGRWASHRAAGRALGLKAGLTAKYLQLRKLSEQQQREVIEGKVAHATLDALLAVAKVNDAEDQQRAFEALVATPARGAGSPTPRASATSASNERRQPVRVRAAAYFNPERFVDERRHARRQIEGVDAFVAELRAKIATSPGRYDARKVSACIDRKLREESLLDAYDVHVSDSKDKRSIEVDVKLDRAEWARRRRYDGFTVLVAHPDLTHTAEALCRLYRAKDAVEKDFQVIKSVVQIRPVWHRTDAKVRAHVTLCMLALLLERTLQRALHKLQMTAEAAIESLAECRLNYYAGDQGHGVYCITQIDTDQRAILKALRLLHLADDADMTDKIRPR
jgi:hypothetical protein